MTATTAQPLSFLLQSIAGSDDDANDNVQRKEKPCHGHNHDHHLHGWGRRMRLLGMSSLILMIIIISTTTTSCHAAFVVGSSTLHGRQWSLMDITSGDTSFISNNKSIFGGSPLAPMSATTRTTITTTASTTTPKTTTQLHASMPSRRDMLNWLGSTVLIGGGTTLLFPDPASATYSAYTHREQDWQERNAKGEIHYSSARQLRSQLRDMVPQNDDGLSKVFCPNGPTSNVSPLMENKCRDDQLAMPSVFGRSVDVVGNSIPGRAGGSAGGMANDPGTSSMLGELPAYDNYSLKKK